MAKGEFTAELIETIGAPATGQLVTAFGGHHLYFPEVDFLSEDHRLVKAVGQQAAAALCEKYSGLRLLIPMGYHQFIALRNRYIWRDRQQGAKVPELVDQYKLSPRQIHNVLSKPPKDLGDADLHPERSLLVSRQLSLLDDA